MSDNLQDICGEKPEGFIDFEILTDPNFIFEKDPNYSVVQLWDKDNNSVFVNSYIECKHYFDGGWSYNPAAFLEQNLQINTLITFTVSFLIVIIAERLINVKK
jgi:hypothetical protein